MTKDTIIIAMDSFKGSAGSQELGEWVAEGIQRVIPEQKVQVLPIADGGEGTTAALVAACQGRFIEAQVSGPLGRSVTARFGMLDEETAVIEMAEASGIALTDQSEDAAMKASTYGVGQLILQAIEYGATKLYLGIGGSATTDGGAGMAQALGAKLLDDKGRQIGAGALGLKDLATIASTELDPRLKEVTIRILSDVDNPLTGQQGTAAVYGPQKGIPESRVNEVDRWLAHYGRIIERDLGVAVAAQPGAGAAGGLGAGLLAFTNARMTSGIAGVLELVHFDTLLEKAELVVTGEGRLDNQSTNGKAPIGIAKRAKAAGVPVVAVVGSRERELSAVYAAGVDLVLPILPRPLTLAEAIASVKENTIMTGETVIRAFKLRH